MKFVINKQTGFFVLQEQEEGESALEKVANTEYTENGNDVTDPEKLITDKKQNFIVNALDKLFGGKPPKVLNIEQAKLLIEKLIKADFDKRIDDLNEIFAKVVKNIPSDEETKNKLFIYGMSKVFFTFFSSVSNDDEEQINIKFEKIKTDFNNEVKMFETSKNKDRLYFQMEKNTLSYIKNYSSMIESIRNKKKEIETRKTDALNQEVDASFEELEQQARVEQARNTLLSDVCKPIIEKVIKDNYNKYGNDLNPVYDFITGGSEDVPTEEQVTIFKNLLDKDISDEDIKKTINSKLDILLKKKTNPIVNVDYEKSRKNLEELLRMIEFGGTLLGPFESIADIAGGVAGLIRILLCYEELELTDILKKVKNGISIDDIKKVISIATKDKSPFKSIMIIKDFIVVLTNPNAYGECKKYNRATEILKLLGKVAVGAAGKEVLGAVKGASAAAKVATENKNTNKKLIKEYREEINNLLIPHMQKQLGFNHPPTINFADDQGNAQDMFGKTAYYNPSTSEITVYITNRHPKDIMRSVAHEIVHHAQNQRGEFENSFNLGEEGYAQNNSHLRSMEEEAYLSGNMIFRDWEDQFKKQRNQKTMVNETNLRAKIRSMIEEEIANQTENEPTKKHEASCECKECTEKKTFLKNKGVKNIAEAVEKELMPLREWRNMELNSLLLNRFGISSPHVLGEKKNKKPDEDGDGVPDWADKKPKDPKVGAKKTPTKKGKIPPQFLKGKKKDESK